MSEYSHHPPLNEKGELTGDVIVGYHHRYMWNTLLVSTAFCVSTLLVFLVLMQLRRRKRRYPPSVSFWRFYRAFNMGGGSSEPIQSLWLQIFKKNKQGMVRMYHPAAMTNIFSTVSPEVVEHIMVTNFSKYKKGENFKNIFREFLGDGIFNADDLMWREQRQLSQSAFSNRWIRTHMCNVFSENALAMRDALKALCGTGKSMDMQELLESYTFDSLIDVAFGKDFIRGSGAQNTAKLVQCFTVGTLRTKARWFDLFWKFKRFFNLGEEREFAKSVAYINTYLDTAITECLKDPSTERPNLLSKLLDSPHKDKKFLRDLILSLMLAGRDTTSTLLGWSLYFLSQHPEVEEKILQELRTVLSDGTGQGVVPPDFETVHSMHYLNATLTEVLRLRPPVIGNSRCCAEDDILPNGYPIKKGEYVMIQIASMGKLARFWDDPLKFTPERFLNDGKFVPPNAYKFPVFNAGRRTCIGKDTSYIEAGVLLATLLPHYKFNLANPTEQVQSSKNLVANIDGGLHMTVHAREQPS